MQSEIEDMNIITEIINGNINLYEKLLTKYEKYTFTIVAKHVPYNMIEEVTHEVFIKAYQSLDRFRKKESFKHWLATIAVRTCYDFWRKEYRKKEYCLSTLSEEKKHLLENVMQNKSFHSFLEEKHKKKLRDIIHGILEMFSPEDRMVLELVHFQDKTGKEVANLLGWSLANVKIRLFRARKKFHALLGNLLET